MKTIIKKSLLLGVVAFGMASCGENSWNDTYLDGFVGGPNLSNVQTLNYTLTADDYKNLAENSANKAIAAEAGVSDALSAVSTLHYLNADIDAETYIPNFLSDPDFQYFTLSDGSAINVTYKVAKDLPEEMIALNAAEEWLMANTFTSVSQAASEIPGLLKSKYTNAQSGDYVVVNYDLTGAPSARNGKPATRADFEMSNVLGAVSLNDEISVKGVVSGICKQGFMLTDKGGTILVYFGSSFDMNAYALGDELEVSGKVSSYNKGFQLPSSSVITKLGHMDYTYPEPAVISGADMDAAITRTTDETARYVQFTGQISISGNYYNVIVPGATTAQGSLYQFDPSMFMAMENGKSYVFTGYFSSISSSRYYNILVTDIAEGAPEPGSTYAVYKYSGSAWAQAEDVDVLQSADYAAMGSSDCSLKDSQPERYLPTYLANKYPYAAADTKKYVLYRYLNGAEVVLRSEEYTFNGTEWINSVSNGGIISETNQFVKRGGAWKMDPSIELTLPVGKNQPTSTWFYQAVVDWVKENVADAADYIDSYGTAEYYSGCSSYQGNLNVNATYDKIMDNPRYAGMSTEEIEETMWTRFKTETCPGALSVLYPNMAPIGDMQPTVTITFTAWTTGKINKVYTIVFSCIAKGTFEFKSLTLESDE